MWYLRIRTKSKVLLLEVFSVFPLMWWGRCLSSTYISLLLIFEWRMLSILLLKVFSVCPRCLVRAVSISVRHSEPEVSLVRAPDRAGPHISDTGSWSLGTTCETGNDKAVTSMGALFLFFISLLSLSSEVKYLHA